MPDPSPALWLKPSSLAYDVGQPVAIWPDSSIYGRDCFGSGANEGALYVEIDDTFPAAECTANDFVSYFGDLVLAGDFSIYAVAKANSDGLSPSAVGFCGPGGNTVNSPLILTKTGMASTLTGGNHGVSMTNNYDAIHLFSVRRTGTVVTWYRDGVNMGSFDEGIPSPQNVTIIARVLHSLHNGGSVDLAQLVLFDQPTSLALDASLTASLMAQYGL